MPALTCEQDLDTRPLTTSVRPDDRIHGPCNRLSPKSSQWKRLPSTVIRQTPVAAQQAGLSLRILVAEGILQTHCEALVDLLALNLQTDMNFKFFLDELASHTVVPL